jgi:hypothetical protein
VPGTVCRSAARVPGAGSQSYWERGRPRPPLGAVIAANEMTVRTVGWRYATSAFAGAWPAARTNGVPHSGQVSLEARRS